MSMTLEAALEHVVSRHTGRYEGKWGISTPSIYTEADFEAWERLRQEVDENREFRESENG